MVADQPDGIELVFVTRAGAQAAQTAIEVVFADGARTLPPWLVAQVGGAEFVQSEAFRAKVATVTYEHFMNHWSKRQCRSYIADKMQGVVKGHLKQIKRGGMR
jgi:hypothetical protein